MAVAAELDGLAAASSRPGLAACAVVLGRLLDSRAQSSKPQAARQLADILDRLHKGAAPRRGRLTLVRSMAKAGTTDAGDAAQ
jgi:hypothetical protein